MNNFILVSDGAIAKKHGCSSKPSGYTVHSLRDWKRNSNVLEINDQFKIYFNESFRRKSEKRNQC